MFLSRLLNSLPVFKRLAKLLTYFEADENEEGADKETTTP